MIEIRLTQGKVAIIDDVDAQMLSPYRWYTFKNKGRGYYAVAAVKSEDSRTRVWMHRLIMRAPNGLYVDHINRDGLDNRRENLRLATPSQNAQNQKVLSGKLSRFKGVTWLQSRGVWYAQIMKDKINHNLGRFDDEVEAARAYDSAAKRLFGAYARLNFTE